MKKLIIYNKISQVYSFSGIILLMKRRLRFDGLWYPSDKNELDKLVLFNPIKDNNSVYGVVPHAGLSYAGSLIKLFFSTLSIEIDKIILLTPSHYYSLENDVVGSGNFSSFETSYNEIEGFTLPIFKKGYEQVTSDEHAVEMILPYIAQRRNIKLCCAHINRFTDVNIATDYAKQILSITDEKTTVLASSDFTHYGPNFRYTPYGNIINDEIVNKVTNYDKDIANQMLNGEGHAAYIKAIKDHATICGIAPMLIVSEMARLKNMKGKILGQSNSLNIPALEKNFVSYISMCWRR